MDARASAERDVTWLISRPARHLAEQDALSPSWAKRRENPRALRARQRRRHGRKTGRRQALFLSRREIVLVTSGSRRRFVLIRPGRRPKPHRAFGLDAIEVAPGDGGKEFVFGGKETGRRWRGYRIARKGDPRDQSEAFRIPPSSRDPSHPTGAFLRGRAGESGSGSRWTGESATVAGLEPGDLPLRWALDARCGLSISPAKVASDRNRAKPVGNQAQCGIRKPAFMRVVMTPDAGPTYTPSAACSRS